MDIMSEKSPTSLVAECQERIAARQSELNAFITLTGETAVQAARSAEREIQSGRRVGPLHGIPIAVKDFYDTAGIRTTAAFTHFAARIPRKNAASVARLEQAGAILMGKTNMHTLGMGTTGLESAFGPSKNPHDPHYIPGGSSSGSAVAVATGMCHATLDTDAIGSCRLPAACCGVVGFKGSYGLVSLEGILAGEQPPGEDILWLSHAGIMSRSVQDAALMLEVLTERRFDPHIQRRVRIGVARNCPPAVEVAAVYDNSLEVLRQAGHQVTNAIAPLVNPNKGIAHIAADREAISAAAFCDVDVFVLPTLPCIVPTVANCGQNPLALSPAYTAFANYYGLPALTVPCGTDPNGLPVGLQFVGRPHEDALVLQVARTYERSRARL